MSRAVEPTATIEWIDPLKASELLARNEDNRALSRAHLKRLTSEIDQVGHRLTPDAIATDQEGNLLNGQHRLTIQVEKGETWEYVVLTGLPTEAWDSTDRGKPRRLQDALRRRGERDSGNLSSVVRSAYQYEHAGHMRVNSGANTIAESVLLDYLSKHPELRDALKFANARTSRPLGLTRTETAVLWHFFKTGQSEVDATLFFERLVDGVGLSEDDAIHVLRRRLERDQSAKARRSLVDRLDPTEKRALVVIAFNKWIKGGPVRQIKWTPGGATKQPFPLVTGYPYPAA